MTAVCEQVFKKFPDFTERCKQAAFEAMSDPIYSGKMKVSSLYFTYLICQGCACFMTFTTQSTKPQNCKSEFSCTPDFVLVLRAWIFQPLAQRGFASLAMDTLLWEITREYLVVLKICPESLLLPCAEPYGCCHWQMLHFWCSQYCKYSAHSPMSDTKWRMTVEPVFNVNCFIRLFLTT